MTKAFQNTNKTKNINTFKKAAKRKQTKEPAGVPVRKERGNYTTQREARTKKCYLSVLWREGRGKLYNTARSAGENVTIYLSCVGKEREIIRHRAQRAGKTKRLEWTVLKEGCLGNAATISAFLPRWVGSE